MQAKSGAILFRSDGLCQSAMGLAKSWGSEWSADPANVALRLQRDWNVALDAYTRSNGMLELEDVITMFRDLSLQVRLLQEISMAPTVLSPTNVQVVRLPGGGLRFWLSPDLRLEKIENGEIVLIHPYEKTRFMAPEMVLINRLPQSVHPTCCYYSLAVLTHFCLAGTIISPDNMKEGLGAIAGTPLCSAIERALTMEPERRRIYYL
jgi:hypothetical protein